MPLSFWLPERIWLRASSNESDCARNEAVIPIAKRHSKVYFFIKENFLFLRGKITAFF
jgi:hypothetical protein